MKDLELKYSKLQFKAKLAVDYLIESADEIEKIKLDYQTKMDELVGIKPVRPLIKYEYQFEVFKYTAGCYDTKYRNPLYTIQQLEEKLKSQQSIRDKNLEIIKENEKVFKLANEFMDRLGIPRTKYDYPTSRSRTKKSIRATWVAELEQSIPRNNIWNQVESWYKEQIKLVQEHNQFKEKSAELAARAAETEKKNKEKEAFIVRLVDKYNLTFDDPIPPIDDVLVELAKRHKFLYFGYYLAKNRGDWSEGCSYAEIGLNYFMSIEPHEDIDEKIIDEISGLIANWDGDGRCFRDATYGYNYLFDVVNKEIPELYSDWSKLYKYNY